MMVPVASSITINVPACSVGIVMCYKLICRPVNRRPANGPSKKARMTKNKDDDGKPKPSCRSETLHLKSEKNRLERALSGRTKALKRDRAKDQPEDDAIEPALRTEVGWLDHGADPDADMPADPAPKRQREEKPVFGATRTAGRVRSEERDPSRSGRIKAFPHTGPKLTGEKLRKQALAEANRKGRRDVTFGDLSGGRVRRQIARPLDKPLLDGAAQAAIAEGLGPKKRRRPKPSKPVLMEPAFRSDDARFRPMKVVNRKFNGKERTVAVATKPQPKADSSAPYNVKQQPYRADGSRRSEYDPLRGLSADYQQVERQRQDSEWRVMERLDTFAKSYVTRLAGYHPDDRPAEAEKLVLRHVPFMLRGMSPAAHQRARDQVLAMLMEEAQAYHDKMLLEWHALHGRPPTKQKPEEPEDDFDADEAAAVARFNAAQRKAKNSNNINGPEKKN
jgi:hypothetical protein